MIASCACESVLCVSRELSCICVQCYSLFSTCSVGQHLVPGSPGFLHTHSPTLPHQGGSYLAESCLANKKQLKLVWLITSCGINHKKQLKKQPGLLVQTKCVLFARASLGTRLRKNDVLSTILSIKTPILCLLERL